MTLIYDPPLEEGTHVSVEINADLTLTGKVCGLSTTGVVDFYMIRPDTPSELKLKQLGTYKYSVFPASEGQITILKEDVK